MTQEEILRRKLKQFLLTNNKAPSKTNFTTIQSCYYKGALFVLMVKKISVRGGFEYFSRIYVFLSIFKEKFIYNQVYCNTKTGWSDNSYQFVKIEDITMDYGTAKLLCRTLRGSCEYVDFKMV